jgi:hypothetical protein
VGDTRWFISSDQSGHEYAVPVSCTAEWEAWRALDDDDEASWEVPFFALRIDGTFTFTDPVVG